MNHVTRISAVAAGGALALGLLAGPAQAAGAKPAATGSAGGGHVALTAVKALAGARIQGRIAMIKALQTIVSDAPNLTSSDQSALTTTLSNDLSGLTTLSTKMSGETTVQAVRADEVTMVDNYRVYLLAVPQVHLSIVFDNEASAGTKLQSAYATLSSALKAAGGGTATEKSQLADMQTQLANAQSAANGQDAALLALQPGPDASTLTAQIKQIRGDAQTARKDLGQALTDAKDLKSELGQS
jgi:hypothetical protein